METLERGFLINVFSERNCPGLLVSILETFEELGLTVLDARVSCSDSFHLEAVGGEVRIKVNLYVSFLYIYIYMDLSQLQLFISFGNFNSGIISYHTCELKKKVMNDMAV